MSKLGRIAPREGEGVFCRHCEPTGRANAPNDKLREAIHSCSRIAAWLAQLSFHRGGSAFRHGGWTGR
jgi:hypothetical protein